MKFALNYSPQAAELLRSGDIEIDLFKCPDWPDLIAEAAQLRPVYIHFPLVAGQRNIAKVGLETIAGWRSRTETYYVNTHLGARVEDLPDVNDPDVAVASMLADVTPLVDCFGADAVMAENVPYPDMYSDKPQIDIEPEVIRRVIESSGCGLLLDLAHARLTAEYMGWDVHEYIEQLPVDRLRELHVTGIGPNQKGQHEDHLPMTDSDWALFEWALAKIHSGAWPTPWVVACEYGGIGPIFDWRSEAAVIAHDIPRMVDLVRTAQPVQVNL